jgi:hypothetical protein
MKDYKYILICLILMVCSVSYATCSIEKDHLCDLIVTGVSWEPVNPAEGDVITFKATIKNTGLAPSPEGVIHGVIWRINNGTVNWSDYYVESLKPGESATLETSGGVGYFAIEGIHKLEVSVDPVWDINRITESDKTNNTFFTELVVEKAPVDRLSLDYELPLIDRANIKLKSVDLGGFNNIQGKVGNTVVVDEGKAYTITSKGFEVALHSPCDWHHFAYLALEGDFDIRVKVDEVVAPYTNYDGSGVLVARESLDGSARILDIKALVPGSLHGNGNFSGRKEVGGNLFAGYDKLFSGGGALDRPGTPVWLRMRRTGNRFLAYYSYDGNSWNSLNSIYSEMPKKMFVGLGVSAFNLDIPVTARFSNLTVYGKLAGESTIAYTPGTGTGLTGDYYNGRNFEEYLFSRIDPVIDFKFIYGDPVDIRQGYEDYSIRWTGFLEPQVSGKHTLYFIVDDGVRMWLDNKLVIDQWKDQATVGLSFETELTKGEKYPIRIEYYDGKIGGNARLLWQTESFPLELIPASQLYPDTREIAQYTPKVHEERITSLIEAENTGITGAASIRHIPFASSEKVVEIPAIEGSGLAWKGISGGTGGVHYLNIRYYSPHASWLDCTKNIYVNDQLIDMYHFFPPGDGGGSYFLKIELEPGNNNSIAIMHESGSKGNLFVDFLGIDNSFPLLPLVQSSY